MAKLASDALVGEAELTPKPGLVDRRGSGAHTDMDLDMLHAAIESLHLPFVECATAAMELGMGADLRATLGEIGRAGEARMLEATGGVNTHRGALWALGLLCAGAALAGDAVTNAARLARTADPAVTPAQSPSHGELARRRYRVGGAVGQAQNGFPAVHRYALPMLSATRAEGGTEDTARVDALLALIAHVDDTCVLHRDGWAGLRAIQSAASATLTAGGYRTPAGRIRFTELDDLCLRRRISPGGSADLLAVTLFLDELADRKSAECTP
ncbi:putative 2-(5''-triphosphoribosyl)-3'-dephosphoc oenzyme-A synthase [Mycolicibacterium canariasense]|uniref:triphosphoribosyl-dephospho-CoA synthase n=1 Tax=Mycolicibacterium canariasense TaxID=228230 RepID=A0A100WB63_MYCCR|nr:putative 2-(5''-triphosphoribosyl)-3'-dephosphoc oenzyme-A synthase [Mycolicibacterium canariasense]